MAAIREEHFGPIEDPRITALRVDAQKLRAELTSETAELAAMATTLKADAEKRLDAIERRIAGLR